MCKIRSNAGDKKTSGVDAENKMTEVYGTKYRINLDHEILTDHGVFYPQALYNDLVFEVTLAPASQVVKGGDPTKLKYKLKNIQLEYEMIRDNQQKRESLGEQAERIYTSGKEFLYDHVTRDKVVTFAKGTETRINIKVNAQRRSMKGLLLLFVEKYTAGTRDSEKYIFPDIKNVSVTINGSPNMLYNNGIEARDVWREAARFFMKEKHKPQYMTMKKFYTDNKFGLLIDLRSMASQEIHGSGTRLVNTTDGIQQGLKEAIGVNLTHDQVKRLDDKDVIKHYKRYETYVGAKTTETLIDSFLSFSTKALGWVVKIKDADALQNELKNDYIITKEMSSLSGCLALRCGRLLAVANAFLITAKHVDFAEQLKTSHDEQCHPSRDENGHPLAGVDEVDNG